MFPRQPHPRSSHECSRANHLRRDVFAAFDVAVGVSVDGPSEATAGRIDWRGRPAFDRIMRGIETLKGRDIAFTVIAVVGKSQIGQARRILDFLADIGCPYVGLNIEEQEGVNKHAGTPTIDQARAFWRDVIEWTYEHPGVGVREVDELFSFLSLADGDRASDTEHDLIPTIGWNGDVVLLSPELLGTHAPADGNFVAGNVLTDPLSTIIDRAHELRYVNEFSTGIENCKADLYPMIERFDALTGVPVVLNTSFNVAGQPIVESSHDAVQGPGRPPAAQALRTMPMHLRLPLLLEPAGASR